MPDKKRGKKFQLDTLKGSEDFLDVIKQDFEKIEKVELVKIKEKENVRKELKNIEELASSIVSQGQLMPIHLRSKGDGFYEIIMGHRRFKAICLLREKEIKNGGEKDKYTTIKAIIKDEENFSDLQIKEMQLIENIQREQLSPSDLRKALEFFKQQGFSHKEIAKKLDKKEGYVKHLFSAVKTLKENPGLSSLLESDVNITLTDVQEIKVLPFKQQVEVIQEKLEGKIQNLKELRSRVHDIKASLYKENHTTHERRKSFEFVSFKDSIIKMRTFKFDLEKNNEKERKIVIEQLRTILDKLEKPLAQGKPHD